MNIVTHAVEFYLSFLPLSATGVSRRGGREGGGTVIIRGSGVVVGGDDATI